MQLGIPWMTLSETLPKFRNVYAKSPQYSKSQFLVVVVVVNLFPIENGEHRIQIRRIYIFKDTLYILLVVIREADGRLIMLANKGTDRSSNEYGLKEVVEYKLNKPFNNFSSSLI